MKTKGWMMVEGDWKAQREIFKLRLQNLQSSVIAGIHPGFAMLLSLLKGEASLGATWVRLSASLLHAMSAFGENL